MTAAPGLDLRVLPTPLAIVRLEPGDAVPAWAQDGAGALHAVVRTARELSIVCAQAGVPGEARAERGFRALEVAGPLDFALTGVLAALAVPLAEAGVAIFAVATYDTDYVLVRDDRLADAVAALRAAGHRVRA
ncbi:MAG: uncharacterized protein QOD81_365 [Solirubrobacteraceae bacterium]|nr:uncharacterized protein [Solirubrobacteraceae bacterium]